MSLWMVSEVFLYNLSAFLLIFFCALIAMFIHGAAGRTLTSLVFNGAKKFKTLVTHLCREKEDIESFKAESELDNFVLNVSKLMALILRQ